jgi:hypothetical protein
LGCGRLQVIAATTIPEYVQASRGDAAAHMALMKAATDAAEAGAIDRREGYAAAELFGRLALGLGHADAQVPLVNVLLTRCAFEHAFADGDPERGCMAAAHALRYLDQAADRGDEQAASALADQSGKLPVAAVEMAAGWQSEEWSAFHEESDRLFADFAAGDVEAGISILKRIRVEAASGGLGDLEVLALAENVTRLGAATGDHRMGFALAETMMSRRRYELSRGRSNGLDYAGALSISLLADLAAAEFPGAEAELRTVVAEVGDTIALDLARCQPIILGAIDPKGDC